MVTWRCPPGLSNLDMGNWVNGQNQVTLFDRLDQAGKKWLIYYYDVPDSLIFVNQRTPGNLSHYIPMNTFFEAVRDEQSFPDFVFIEPKYFGLDSIDGRNCITWCG